MNETWPTPEQSEPDPAGEVAESQKHDRSLHRRIRFAVWGVALVLFAGFLSIWRVHTYLGVEAEVWDKNGRDYVWSVWWRARHDMIGSAPSSLFIVVYLGLIIAFLGLSILAVWLALVPDEPTAESEVRLSGATPR